MISKEEFRTNFENLKNCLKKLNRDYESDQMPHKLYKLPGAFGDVTITKVMFNKPATIVFWSDGTKTLTKCHEGDTYSREAGLSICILKKLCGKAGMDALRYFLLPGKDLVTMNDIRKIVKAEEKASK